MISRVFKTTIRVEAVTFAQVFQDTSRLQKSAPLLLSILLVLGMSGYLAWQAEDWRERLEKPAQIADADTPSSRSTASPEQLNELFGPSQNSSTKNAPQTNLRLTLLGSFVHVDSSQSSAMIRYQDGPALRFTVGSEITDGVRLDAVYPDRVELSRNARQETLTFPADSSFVGMSEETESAPSEITNQGTEEQSNDLADRLRALREQLDQGAAADTPSNPATGNE